MSGGADNPNGELQSYIIGANTVSWVRKVLRRCTPRQTEGLPSHTSTMGVSLFSLCAPQTMMDRLLSTRSACALRCKQRRE